jgi:hypothetical protein
VTHVVLLFDAANSSFITTLKQAVNENPDYTQQIAHYKKNYPSVYDLQFLQQNRFVISGHFSNEHKVEYQNGYMAIYPRHNKLIPTLRTAAENGEGSLDKEATSHDDLYDSFRLMI